ncbi:MAG: hypothetical protein WCT27_02065 [Patescibacteria group bacterium]|jgi:hypothetical protein
METGKLYDIHNGPSKLDLGIALLKGRKLVDDVDFVIDLTDEGGGRFLLKCSISSLAIEDGSRESWLITGYAMLPDKMAPNGMRRKFEGYFHTVKRIGTIKLVE